MLRVLERLGVFTSRPTDIIDNLVCDGKGWVKQMRGDV